MDAHKNFAISLIASAPSPATSGTSITVTTGEGVNFPAVPFNAVIWPTGVNPTNSNAEIVRVIAIATDVFTIIRTQENTSARSVVVGDQISASITAKTLNDVEGIRNTEGDIVIGANRAMIVVAPFQIDTPDVVEVLAGGCLVII